MLHVCIFYDISILKFGTVLNFLLERWEMEKVFQILSRFLMVLENSNISLLLIFLVRKIENIGFICCILDQELNWLSLVQ